VLRESPRFALVCLTVIGCSVEPLDLSGRECPCIAGWVCVDNRCVASDAGADTGGSDTRAPTDTATPIDTGVPTDTSTPTDTGTMDTTMPPDPTGCDDVHAGALFCDGFEGGDLSLWDGVRRPRDATATFVTDIVFRGDRALRAETLPGGTNGAGPEVEVFPVDGTISEQWFRAYYYVPADPGLNLEIQQMREITGAYDWVHSLGTSGSNMHSHSLTPSLNVSSSSDVFPVDTWVCIETHVRLNDDTDGVIEVYWDGLRIMESSLPTLTPRGLSQIFAGVSWKDSSATRVVYIDELVADDEMIGCD
jgi:hypothetical protein